MICGPDTFLPGVGADCTPTLSLDTSPSSPSNGTNGGPAGLPASSPIPKSSEPTPEPLNSHFGRDAWIVSMRAPLVLNGVRPAVAWETRSTIQKRLSEQSACFSPNGSSWNAWQTIAESTADLLRICEKSDTPLPVRSSWTLPRWVRRILGPDTGLLATPTRTANQSCRSMQKWPCCRRLTLALGKLTPRKYAWMMGWPNPTSSLLPMAMGKFPSARRSRGKSSGDRNAQ